MDKLFNIYSIIAGIAGDNYDKADLKDKLDVFLLANRITDEQYKELIAEINSIQ